MAEHKLKYTAAEIDRRLGEIDNVVKHTQQSLTEEQKTHARTNIGAVSIEEVEELLGIEEEFSVTGELVQFDLDIEPGTELEIISKIHRDETWGESNKLVLHQVSGCNFVDLSSYLGGVGKTFQTNGLTATINADCTLTVKGTNSSTGWTKVPTVTDWHSEYSKRIYPAGTYTIPSGFAIQIRNAKYPDPITINGATGNLSGKFVTSEPFRIISIYYSVAGSKTVDVTVPLGLFRSESLPEDGHAYVGNVYTVTFDDNIYEGEYNWTTGELKDVDGNIVAYYDPQSITSLSGINYFWTGFGENTVSNKSDNLEKIVILLGESAPAETVTSICDFTLTPTTPQAAYCLHDAKVRNGGVFNKHELPLVTTKGTVSVVNSDGEITTEKYVNALINWQGVSDILTNKGVHKAWSEKFYFTKEPVLQEDFTDINNALYTFEFTEEDFQNNGLPAKRDNIPIVSPCFYTGTDAASKLNSRVWGGSIFPATLSWDGASGKYIFKVRGLYPGSIMAQLMDYSKGYFHYQLETPYDDELATVAMGISSGDTVTFTVDDSDWKTYLDGELYKDADSKVITAVDTMPTGFVYIPRNAVDACDGMINAARMLNNAGRAGGDETVQGYSWIGEGDGTTDYTTKIQSKLDSLHLISGGGTIHLGSGTYRISNSLFVYENTRIIGNEQTIIEQTADNTHALVLCGNDITIEDLSIKLSGACNTVTACIYVNSNNKPAVADYNSAFPETGYVQRLTIDNVFMSGEYKFGSKNGYPVVSDAYENYMGVGIYNHRLYFNYAHVDNVHFKYFMAGVHGGGGCNYFNITSEFCKYGLYITNGGDNTYFVDGHPYYTNDENGDYITMSDAIAYVEREEGSTFHLRSYDTQAYKKIIFLDSQTKSNKIDIQHVFTNGSGLFSRHKWNILKWFIIDYGQGNVYSDQFKNTPFHIGSHVTTIAKGSQSELSNPVIQNALSGAGIWGNISSNVEFVNNGITLRDVCRYPSEKNVWSNYLPYILSTTSPSEDSPIEITIDYSNRPVIGLPNYFIQFYHDYVASDYTVSFDTTNTGVYDFELPVIGNTNITEYFDYPQIGTVYKTYRMKFRFTKPLQISNMVETLTDEVFDYNPNGLIGICNIGMTINDYAGRSFLGECGGNLYGNVDMHQNTLKNLPDPVDAGDAISKSYLEAKLIEFDKYYTNLSSAITDINNGNWNNAIIYSDAAKVKVFTSDDGKLTVMLLDDVTESTLININKDIELVLNGKTLSFSVNSAYINFASETNCTINGMSDGSKIIKNLNEATANPYLINTAGKKLYIIGGSYECIVPTSKSIVMIRATSTNEILDIANASILGRNDGAYDINTTDLYGATGIQFQGKKLNCQNINVTVSGRMSSAIMTIGNITIEDSNISATATHGQSHGIYCPMDEDNAMLVVKNSIIKADAIKGSLNSGHYGTGIASFYRRTIICENSNIRGTGGGIISRGESAIYINGGTYNGFYVGGLALIGDFSGLAYLNDATFTCGDYQGIFDYSSQQSEGCICCEYESQNNGIIYMDNCTIGTLNSDRAFYLSRGNCTINISNSNSVADDIYIRDSSQILNVGVGCNITEDNITGSGTVIMTNNLYRKNYAGKVLNGNDFNVLVEYINTINSIEQPAYFDIEEVMF